MSEVKDNLSNELREKLRVELALVGIDEDKYLDELEEKMKQVASDNNKVDRVKDWDEFSSYMRNYIKDKTVDKYGKKTGIDLMAVTDPDKCIWNAMKYIFRLYNGQGKRYDLEKIIHYAQMAITLSDGDLSQCGVRESENPNKKFWLE